LGGAQLALVRHIKYLNRQFFTPLVVCAAESQPLLERLGEQEVKVVVLPFARFKAFSPWIFWRFFRTCLSLLLVVRKERPDLIVSNTERAAYPTFLVAKLLHRKTIFWVRDFEYSPTLLKLLSRGAARLVFVSQAVRDYYGFTGDTKAKVVYVGTDIYVNRPEGSATDPSGHKVLAIGFAGRLVAWKGAQVLLQAARSLRDGGFLAPVWKVIIAGEGRGQAGENERELREYVREQHLEERVRFIGFQREMLSFYQALDIFVHPSLQPEPFATVVVEALAAGLPVLASRAGGTPEIIADGENGSLFPPGDVRALAEQLKKLLSDAVLRRRLGNQARETVAQNFTEEKVTREMESVYREVLGQ
jgi:glycosyltransferase involved in cell wall biosynthesis